MLQLNGMGLNMAGIFSSKQSTVTSFDANI
jgi:hypothetical protein